MGLGVGVNAALNELSVSGDLVGYWCPCRLVVPLSVSGALVG